MDPVQDISSKNIHMMGWSCMIDKFSHHFSTCCSFRFKWTIHAKIPAETNPPVQIGFPDLFWFYLFFLYATVHWSETPNDFVVMVYKIYSRTANLLRKEPERIKNQRDPDSYQGCRKRGSIVEKVSWILCGPERSYFNNLMQPRANFIQFSCNSNALLGFAPPLRHPRLR